MSAQHELEVRRHRWLDAFTKDRCGCFFETALVARWIDEFLAGADYTPGPGAEIGSAAAPSGGSVADEYQPKDSITGTPT